MKVKHRLSYRYIKKRVVKKAEIVHPNIKIHFDVENIFPIKHRLYLNNKSTNFYFTRDTINELLNISKASGDQYKFVISSIYYSVLAEISKVFKNGKN
jgi:hypothetical protein